MLKIKIAGLSLLCILLFTSFRSRPYKKQIVLTGFSVIELFTSEGCSSCPPADEALIKLSKEFAGKPVYFLSFHVDYWDNKSWKDPFSDHAYTERQRNYNQLLHTQPYTPQAIINGKQELIGSEMGNIRNIIKEGLKVWPQNSISFGAAFMGDQLTVKYQLHTVSPDEVVNIALVQEHATDHITGGENSGASISHINVVRAFKTVSAKLNGSAQMTIPADLAKRPFRIITYIQNKTTWHVIAGNSLVISPSK